MVYELRYLPPAKKFFKKIKNKHLKEELKKALVSISKDPYSGEKKTGDLSDIWCKDVFYDKKNYEIAYRIYEMESKTVVVIMAGTRENFYNELKRYINS